MFHQHFYKGLCMCSCHVEELYRVWGGGKKQPNFLRVRGNVLGDDGKCLCLRARAATVSSWQELVQQPDVVHSIRRATSVQWLESWAGQVLKASHQAVWPTRTERTHFLRREWVTDWLKWIKKRKEKKKCVNKEQPFLDVSKRGRNSSPDFYLSEYLLNVMEKTRWDRC